MSASASERGRAGENPAKKATPTGAASDWEMALLASALVGSMIAMARPPSSGWRARMIRTARAGRWRWSAPGGPMIS